MKTEGYEEAHDNRVITIFSAPNYCDFTGNMAAYIRLRGDEMKPKFTKFAAVVHIHIFSLIQMLVQWPTLHSLRVCSDCILYYHNKYIN